MATSTLESSRFVAELKLDSESELSLLLDELLERDLPCGSANHSSDSKNHDLKNLATMRGTPPCGSTLNVCAKFARYIQAQSWFSVSCLCGGSHQAWTIEFVKI